MGQHTLHVLNTDGHAVLTFSDSDVMQTSTDNRDGRKRSGKAHWSCRHAVRTFILTSLVLRHLLLINVLIKYCLAGAAASPRRLRHIHMPSEMRMKECAVSIVHGHAHAQFVFDAQAATVAADLAAGLCQTYVPRTHDASAAT